ncbi:MAG: small ribosomal subunit Rsm22 family protein [Verrucomicrobium sp.]|nr:small ribosomal subunit Rsm22 family protein [Verrucomicrobium sp.]
MTWDEVDWASLERLRALFLRSEPVREPYWRNLSDLASYDFTYAQRIAWKWGAALSELQRLGWSPPPGPLLDWGCGSGVASRCVVDAFGPEAFPEVRLHDRSALAMQFASRRARDRFPGLRAEPDPLGQGPCTTLVISHVLNELHRDDLPRLLESVRSAHCVLWLEPGTHACSRGLITLREQLRSEFHLVAPCPHRQACGLQVADRESDWCHFFAKAPTEAFTDGEWVQFGRRAGIDLRSLPYSWLVLDRRPVAEWSPDRARVVGLPQSFKPYTRLDACHSGGPDGAAAVDRLEIAKRADPGLHRRLRESPPPPEIPRPR